MDKYGYDENIQDLKDAFGLDLYNQMYMNEMYIGKTSTLVEAERILDKMVKEMRVNPTKDYTNSKENKELGSLLSKQFGFKETSIVWERFPEVFTNYATLFSADITYAGWAMLEKGLDKGFYDKSHKHVCLIIGSQTLPSYMKDLTTPELMAILLHEIGHNFDTSPYMFVTVTYAIIQSIINSAKNFNEKLYAEMAVRIMSLLTLTSFGKTIASSLAKMWENFLDMIPILKELGYTLGKILSFYYKMLNPLAVIYTTPMYVKNLIQSPLQYLVFQPMERKGEIFADSFATCYGYGKELSSALVKIEHIMTFKEAPNAIYDFMNNLALCEAAILNDILNVGHGSSATRIQSTLTYLRKELTHNRNYPESVKREINNEINELEKTYRSYLSADDNNKSKAVSVVRTLISKVFFKRPDIIARILPAFGTDMSSYESANDNMIEVTESESNINNKCDIMLKSFLLH